jgi:hypothetical protein
VSKTGGVRTWAAYFPTVGDLIAIGVGLFGVIMLVLVPILAISAGFVPGAVIGCVIGLGMIGGAFWTVFAPARRVEVDSDGVATFIGRRRSLVVAPGDLESISAVPTFGASDGGKRSPMLVVARRGQMRLQTPADCEGLFRVLAERNPEAHLDRARDWL